jgi:cytochrome c oxidase cbb3-type subunit 3
MGATREWTSGLSIALLFLAGACGPKRQAARPANANPPAAGTAPLRLAVRYDQHVFAGGMAPSGDTTMRNPYAGQPKLASEGGKLFNSMNCDGCHSAAGEGWVAPSLNDGRWRYGGSDGAVFHSIYYGRPRGMPAFGGMLAPEAIWRIVTYIRSLPVAQAVPTQTW